MPADPLVAESVGAGSSWSASGAGGTVVGVGCSLGCPPAELDALVRAALADVGIADGGATIGPATGAADRWAETAADTRGASGRAVARAEAGVAVAAVATVDRRAEEPCMITLAAGLGVPLVLHAPDALARVEVPTPSQAVLAHVGTPSVAEAAALLTAGPGARLVVTKRRSAHATCAVARSRP